MAWYNLNNTDQIAKEFCKRKRIERCGFCGQEKEIRTDKKIYFSEFEVEDRAICYRMLSLSQQKSSCQIT